MAIIKKKQSPLSSHGIKHIDHKDIDLLKMFLTPHGQIQSQKKSGLSSKEQRALALAVKRARFLSLLPFTVA